MFFDMDLLCYKRQGKFGLIWLAATRGLATIKRGDVNAVNIERICNEILKYIMSRSTSPKDRLSLYLSGKLLYGTVLIYKQQVNNFEQTVVTFFCSIKKPLITIDCDDDDRVKKKKTTRPKTLKQIDIVAATQAEQIRGFAQDYERNLPDANANVIDSIHITLLDGDIGRLDEKAPNFFGDEGQIDQQLAQLCGDNWTNIPAVPIFEENVNPQPMNVYPGIVQASEPVNIHDILPAQVTTPRQSKHLVRSPEESPSKRRRTAAQDETVGVIQVVQEQSPRPEVRPLDNEQNEMPPPRRRPPIRRRLSGTRKSINIDIESPSRWRRTRLDRPVMDLQAIVPISAQRDAMQLAVREDPRDIIALILAGVQYDDNDINSIVRGAQDNISIESARANLTAIETTLGRTIEPIAEQSIQIQEIFTAQPEPNSLQIDDIVVHRVPSPRFSNILRENEEKINVYDVPPPRLHASTPKSNENEFNFETPITRQMNLLHRIRTLFRENGNTAIQLNQLCDILIRPTIAYTFCDLLYLQSKQNIRMECVPQTTELGNIYPGEKLYSN